MASISATYLEGRSEKSARDTFFYYSGNDPSAVRYKNWKIYFAMVSDAPAGFLAGVVPYHWSQVVNIKRDPFETSIGEQSKTLMGMGGALAGPATAYLYDWNMLPIGQALWLRELETYRKFPPMQDPASYNLEQVMEQLKKPQADPGPVEPEPSKGHDDRPAPLSQVPADRKPGRPAGRRSRRPAGLIGADIDHTQRTIERRPS